MSSSAEVGHTGEYWLRAGGSGRRRAYVDEPLPIPHGQVTMQPSLVAKMVDALALTSSERVLEIGTGYGWQTALLARLASFVWSVERWPYGARNAEVVVGDGQPRPRRAGAVRGCPRLRRLPVRSAVARGAARAGRPPRP